MSVSRAEVLRVAEQADSVPTRKIRLKFKPDSIKGIRMLLDMFDCIILEGQSNTIMNCQGVASEDNWELNPDRVVIVQPMTGYFDADQFADIYGHLESIQLVN